jgi:oxygen-dependent protoporphyrinogen oxidase
MIFVPRDSPAARDRWLYYPDHLVHVPHPSQGVIKILQTLLTEEAFKGFLWDAATEILKEGRKTPIEDESIGDFFSRRVNKKIVDQVLSGVLHGIYAGDAYQLSAKSLMPELWYGEKEHTSMVQGMTAFKEAELMREDDMDLVVYLAERAVAMHPGGEKAMRSNPGGSSELDAKLNDSSVFTLKRGLQSMTERMESLLNMAENVTFKTGTPVSSLKYDQESQKIEVRPISFYHIPTD